jgi:nucleoside-diphosphate-sugar epimerase
MAAIVTGASGFVGSVLLGHLPGAGALSLAGTDWRERLARAAFAGATVYHLGGRVHRGGGEAAFMEDNVEKTEALARAAARGGALAFVYVSTAKVNGEESGATPFRASDTPRPDDPYARSKWAAEQRLARVAAEDGLPVAVVRPPLVYGRGAGANLLALLRICDSPWPLPFASLHNRRSFIEVNDLARLLLAARHARRGEIVTYMAAHPDCISTARLVAVMRKSLGRTRRLFALPRPLLEAAATLAGQRANALRLTRSLEVDAAPTRAALGWQAQIPLEQAVDDMVDGYRDHAAA